MWLFCDPMDCRLPGSPTHEIFQARVMEWVAISFSRGSSWPRDWIKVSCIAGTREAHTWVGRLSLFQRIIPTQGSNPGLPHCGRILYQLSHKGSPTLRHLCLKTIAWPTALLPHIAITILLFHNIYLIFTSVIVEFKIRPLGRHLWKSLN